MLPILADRLPRMRTSVSAVRFVALSTVLVAASSVRLDAVGNEYSVRWDEAEGPFLGGTVSLYHACDPYKCGLAESEGQPIRRAAFQASFGPGGIFRSEVPEERDAWWIVVHGDGRVPMAMLWRPAIASGDLVPVPVLNLGSCRLAVQDTAGAGVSGALVFPGSSSAPEVETPAGARPAVFQSWRPWYRPARTDSHGLTDYRLRESTAMTLHVRAPGFRVASVPCASGRRAVVVLEPREQRSFLLRDESGQPLKAALVRDQSRGVLAVSDERGQIPTRPWGNQSFDTDSGVVFGSCLRSVHWRRGSDFRAQAVSKGRRPYRFRLP